MTGGPLVTCRTCRHEYIVPERHLGQRIACPHCRAVVVVERRARGRGADDLVGRTVGGCRLVRRLGAGAMGAVYEAEQLSLGRRAAVKLLNDRAVRDPTLVKRFRREARLAATIRHPNVVGVYDHGQEGALHYLVMEYVEGDTLAGLIREAGRLPWRQAAGYIVQVGRALERLAAEGIAHRDIKPANILVDAVGVAKVADLGLAKQVEGGDATSVLTMAGTVMGSPAYMAPEQALDTRDVTPAADVYALGATFYHAVSGQAPYTGKNAMEVIRRLLHEDPVPVEDLVEDLPAGIAGLIADLMARDPAERPENVAEAVREIVAVVEAPTRYRRARRRRGGGRRRRPAGGGRRALWLVLTVLAVLAVVGLGLWLGRR